MNEQANKILTELLQKASNGIDAAVSFSQAQIPDVIHQLLLWNAVSSIISQVVALIVFPVVAILLYRGLKQRGEKVESQGWRGYTFVGRSIFWDEDGDFSFPGFMCCMVGGLAMVWCALAVTLNFDWLKIWLAPKLYLIEYAAHLVK